MTPTPRTGDALESILREKGELSEDTAPAVLVKLCRQLERENAAMREAIREAYEALKTIASYDKGSTYGDGLCPYGCDTPYIANKALTKLQHYTKP
jgi:hypothetical protein